MYNKTQQKIVVHTRKLVYRLFSGRSVPAHNLDHIVRVRNLAIKIAKKEKADVFLSELSAWLHDVGRIVEKKTGHCHHFLSYKMCRGWFRSDPGFKDLSRRDKLVVLYAVRNHWNDMANKYPAAWILRDADKIDGYGRAGVKRMLEGCHHLGIKYPDFRLCIYTMVNLKTATAKKIVRDKKLFDPIKKVHNLMLKKQVVIPSL